ncbi:MAG: LamG domain-containing protein [Planctomycetota bacterium]
MMGRHRLGSAVFGALFVLFALGVCVCGPAPADQDPSLVAYYTFEEGPGDTIRDYSGKGNHGRNLGAKYVSLPDGKGYALAFDTPDATVDCGNESSVDLRDQLAIEVWVLPQTEVQSGEMGLVGREIDSFMLELGRTCWLYVQAPEGKGRTDVRTKTVVGAWQHIAATFDGRQSKIYLDGMLMDAADAVAPGIKPGKQNLHLRYPLIWGDKIDPPFRGMIDDVRVYRRALSREEILAHYKEKAAEKGKDTSSFDQINLIAHSYPLASTLLVEADFSGLLPAPPGTTLSVELRDASKILASTSAPLASFTDTLQYGHTTSVCPISAVSAAGKLQWVLSTSDIPPGTCQVRAVARGANEKVIGTPGVADVTLPDQSPWLKQNPGAKVLNNLVIQLLDVASPAGEPRQARAFLTPRDGWIYISSVADVGVRISLDGAPAEDAVIVHDEAASKETMRYLKTGPHSVEVYCPDGARLQGLIVRAIPEMIFDSIGYRPCPWIKCYGPYDWDFFEKCGIMDVVNVFAERDALTENADRSRAWQARGKKILWASFIDWMKDRNLPPTEDKIHDFLADHIGLKKPHLDGTLMSEFDGFGYPTGLDDYPLFAAVVTRLSQDARLAGKAFHPYGKFMYLDGRSIAFMQALIDGGYKFAEEIYMQEKPTEQAARAYLDALVRQRMLRYQAALRDCQKGMIAVLAYFSIPAETVNVDPNANYKVFMDMQMNLLANDPVFSELYGVMWYHCAYADEESLRWSARLLRHYCIEGRRDMLSRDPYELTHIANADFRQGAAGWKLAPAEAGSIQPKNIRTLGQHEGRYPEASMGDYCLLTRRCANRPNRFSQRVRNLEPGRLYSVKMLTTDYEDITQGRSEKKEHVVSIKLHNVDILPDRSICEPFTRGGGSYAKEDRAANRWITYRVVFFRPKAPEATLIISDWKTDTDPGGPVGQQLIHNFIEIEPYLEEGI